MALVKVTPVEYSDKRIVRYYGYKIGNIDVEQLQTYVSSGNFRIVPRIWQEGEYIFYEYPDKPLIIIKDGKLHTTEEIWNGRDFADKEIRHQASFVLRVLHGANLASYNRKAIRRRKFTPRRYRPYHIRYYEDTHHR